MSQAREERYAEALRSHRVEVNMASADAFGWHCLTCGAESAESWRSIEAAEQHALSHNAAAVVAVADAELAEARAEIDAYEYAVSVARIERDKARAASARVEALCDDKLAWHMPGGRLREMVRAALDGR